MKRDPDNFRQSAIQGGMSHIKKKDVQVIINEPTLKEEVFSDSKVFNDFEEFKKVSDLIVANRLSDDLREVRDKLYTRDLFSRD